MSSSLQPYNNVPFSEIEAHCFLPSSSLDFNGQYTAQHLSLPSFFDHPAFADSDSYDPPADFLTRPRRVSGEVPEIVYPQKLVAWFYSSEAKYPYVYEDALDLYFCTRIPFSMLRQAFSGDSAVLESRRKHHVLSLAIKFDLHLVRSFSFSSLFVCLIVVFSNTSPSIGFALVTHLRSLFIFSLSFSDTFSNISPSLSNRSLMVGD